MRSIVCLAVFVLLVSLPTPTRGATVPYRTDAELIALATRVVRGRVLDSVAERRPDGTIRTRTRIAVLEDFTGAANRVVTIYELGGVLGDGASMVVPGSPHFTRGDEVGALPRAHRRRLPDGSARVLGVRGRLDVWRRDAAVAAAG